MRGHEWRKNHPAKQSAMDYDPIVITKSWKCAVCGCEVYAVGQEKLPGARHRMKIPADCDRVIVRVVHEGLLFKSVPS